MPIIAVANSLIDETTSAVKLARYAQIVGYAEDQFNGLANADTQQEACKPIWTHPERVMVARYLAEAQEEIEQITRYPLYPRWFVNEQHKYKYPLHTDWMKIIEVGYRHAEVIATGVAVSHVTDPAVVSVATTVTDEDYIRVMHPGTEIEIIPSAISISGGVATIQIPRARLVEAASVNNPATGWDYDDIPPSATSPFLATVDIYSVHNNTDIEGGLVWSHRDSSNCVCDFCCDACLTCGEYTQTACIYVRNYETGAIDILPASYSGGSWTSALCSTCYCTDPDLVRVNYRAGLTTLTKQLEDAVIRLGHSKMPNPPCGCGHIMELWTRDRHVPEVLTSERLNCKFGLSDGAWWSWQQANAVGIRRGYVIG